jgi:hypothetical protein
MPSVHCVPGDVAAAECDPRSSAPLLLDLRTRLAAWWLPRDTEHAAPEGIPVLAEPCVALRRARSLLLPPHLGNGLPRQVPGLHRLLLHTLRAVCVLALQACRRRQQDHAAAIHCAGQA